MSDFEKEREAELAAAIAVFEKCIYWFAAARNALEKKKAGGAWSAGDGKKAAELARRSAQLKREMERLT